MKYSPMAAPAMGAMYCSGAESAAVGVHDDGVSIATARQASPPCWQPWSLLADGHVDADHVLAALVDDGIDGNGRLAGLAVADDELALAAADGDHGVDGQDARLQRFAHRRAVDNARGLELDGAPMRSVRMSPKPSMGSPSGFTTRPSMLRPTGMSMMRPVVCTGRPRR